MVKGYCFRCKKDQEIENKKEVIMKNKRRMLKGVCKICGCRMTKFLWKEKSLKVIGIILWEPKQKKKENK